MSFSRYNHSANAFSRPVPEPEVRCAILAKRVLSDRSQVRDSRTAGASNGGARP
jgi:hypothetical protein